MTPAAISLVYKYQLNSSETDALLLRTYNNCSTEFTATKSYIEQSHRIPKTTLYKDYPQLFKTEMQGELNRIITNMPQLPNMPIPKLTDKSGTMVFAKTNLSFDFDDSNGFVLYFYFTTEIMTWVGTVGNHLILSLGDVVKTIEDNGNVATFSLEYDNNLWISTYKK